MKNKLKKLKVIIVTSIVPFIVSLNNSLSTINSIFDFIDHINDIGSTSNIEKTKQ